MASHQCWMFYLLLFIKIIGNIAEELCDQCECYISDGSDQRAIRNIKPRCNEGSIQWTNPTGALRVELQPGYASDFRACFVVDAANIIVKISQESGIHPTYHYLKRRHIKTQLKTVLIATNRSKEYCIYSGAKPVLLYIEAERPLEWRGLERVKFHYIIESRSRRLTYSPMEECRPCDDKELIRAYCSSDFVVVGTMDSVKHMDAIARTGVDVRVTRLIRQKPGMFQYNSQERLLKGTVVVPRKCDIKHGHGDFLFTGRMRLGHMTVACVPYLENWESVLRNALIDGSMQCAVD